MAINSWLHLAAEDPRHALPERLRQQDPMAAQDCGWVEQMLPFVRSHASPGAWIVDPFCGFGSTLVAAALGGVPAAGIELDAKRSAIARERLALLGIDSDTHPVLTGSVADPSTREQLTGQGARSFTLCLTNVPYFGCSANTGPGGNVTAGQLYEEQHYADYLQGLRDVFSSVHQLLEPEGWCVVMVQNLQLGRTFVPLAWDIARLLSDRFVAHEERLLIYDQPSEPGAAADTPTNRAHEYALVFRKQASGMDPAEGDALLKQLAQDRFEFAVYGSFAQWLLAGDSVLPGDVDLLCPPDDAELSRLLQWLEAHGFLITSWNTPVRPPVSGTAFAHRYYFRARRLRRDGAALQIDVSLVASRERYDTHVATCRRDTPALPYSVLIDCFPYDSQAGV